MKLLLVIIMGGVVSAAPADNSSPPESQPAAVEGSPADHQPAGAQEQQVQTLGEEKQSVQEKEYFWEGSKLIHSNHPMSCEAQIHKIHELDFISDGLSKTENQIGYSVECGMSIDLLTVNGPTLATYYDSCKTVCQSKCEITAENTVWTIDGELEQSLIKKDNTGKLKEEMLLEFDEYAKEISASNEKLLMSKVIQLLQQLKQEYSEIEKARGELVSAMTGVEKQKRYQTAMQALKQIGEGQSDGKSNTNENQSPKQK